MLAMDLETFTDLVNSYLASSENGHQAGKTAVRSRGATLFDDRISNVTYATRDNDVGQYFEGNNFYVYIHGSDDPEGDWWSSENFRRTAQRGAGVLVNCHFDS